MAAVIIVAAGSGKRMKNSLPKQYMDLAGLPILARTLMAFDAHAAITRIFLVVAPGDIEFCRKTVLSVRGWIKDITLVPGGAHRQDSVWAGLKAAETAMGDDDIVVIHDGARPLVSGSMITACIEGAAKEGACIVGVPAYDTLKQADACGVVSGTLPREYVYMAQTPQAFTLKRIRQGFENARAKGLLATDDAALVEMCGMPVHIIPGSRTNIKITTPEDLDMASALIMLAGKT